jgi:hypothetical protein
VPPDLTSGEEGDAGSGRRWRKAPPDLVVVGGSRGATTVACGQKQRERGGGDLAIVDLAAAVINPVVVDPEGGVAKLRGGPGLLHLGEPV